MSQASFPISRWALFRQALGEWWIPLFLSLLPVLVLIWNGREEAAREDGERLTRLRLKCDRLGQKLREESEPGFWLREGMIRLHRLALKQGVSRTTPWWHQTRSCLPKGLEETRIWAFQNQDRFRPLTGPGLESDFSEQFARLLQELSRPFERGGGQDSWSVDAASMGAEPKLVNRWRMILGTGISAEVFAPSNRMRPFHVIFQGQPSLMAWDLVVSQGKSRNGFILIFPVGNKSPESFLQICLKNWTTRSPRPAFLPLPYKESGPIALPMLHRGLCHESILQSVLKLQERMGIFPDAHHPLYDKRVRTLAPLLGRIFQLEPGGRHWGYLAPVDPTSGHIGLLVFRPPGVHVSGLEALGILLLFFWAGIWGLWLGRVLTSGRIPSPGIHLEVVVWLLVMVSMPLALSYGIGVRLVADFSANRLERLRSDLRQILNNVETGVVLVNQAISQEIRSFWRRPALMDDLMKEGAAEPLLSHLKRQLSGKGFHMSGTLLFRRNLPGLAMNLQGIPLATQKLITRLLTMEWKAMTGEAKRDESGGLDLFTSGSSSWGRQTGSLESPLETPGTLRAWKVGERQWNMFSLLWEKKHQPMIQLNCFWNQDAHLEDYLQKAFDSQVRLNSAGGLSLGAYRIQGGRVQESSAATGEVAGRKDLARLAGMAVKQPVFLERPEEGDLVMAFASRELPGFVLLGRLSTQSLKAGGRRLMNGLVLLMMSLLLMAAMVSFWLRRRMAEPVSAMAEALEAVGTGNLEVRVEASRQDELGFAGRAVNTMTAWLRERRLLSRFVAPQVLDVVAGGDYRRAMEGDHRRVAVLVSDIRNFTSLSESSPPAEIFKLLNQHMERMTRVIQGEGGVIDRFIGDAIQAVFYENPEMESCAIRAIRAAGFMKVEHLKLNQERQASGSFAYGIGIGIDAGMVVAGVIGDPGSRLDFTVIGESVRQAGELEASSKQSRHTGIIVSPPVYQAAGEAFPFEPLGDSTEMFELVSLREPGAETKREMRAEKAFPVEGKEHVETNEGPRAAGSDSETVSWGWFLVLWLLPGLWLLGINIWEQWRIQDVGLAENRRRIEETLGTFEKKLDPAFQAGFWLQQQLQRLPAEPFSHERWQQTWSSLHRLLPKASFTLLKMVQELPQKDALSERECSYDERYFGIATGSESPPFPLEATETRKLWAALFFHDLLFPAVSPEERRQPMTNAFFDWRREILELSDRFNAPGDHGIHELVRKGMDAFHPMTIDRIPGAMLWKPVRNVEKRNPGPAEKTARTTGLMIFCPLAGFTPTAGYQFFLENLCLRGLEGAVAWRESNGWQTRMTPGFFGKPWFQVMAKRLGKKQNDNVETLSGFREMSGGVLGWRQIVGNEEVILVVGARHSGLKATGNPDSETRWIPLLLWLAGGLGWVLSRNVRNLPRQSLVFQMVGSFGLVILPCLILGSQLLEIFLQERTARMERDRGVQLVEEMESMDRGQEIMATYFCRVIERDLSARCRQDEWKASLGTVVPEANRWNDPFWQRLVKISEWRKVWLRNILAAGVGNYARGFMQESLKVEGFRVLMEKNLQKMNPDFVQGISPRKSFGENKSAIIGAQVDEFVDSMQTMVPPEVYAAQLASPRYLARLRLQKADEQYFYLQHVMSDGCPRAVVQVVWGDKPMLCLLQQEWEAFQELSRSDTVLETAFGTAPGWRFIPPFWKLSFLETPADTGAGSSPGIYLREFTRLQLQEPAVAQLQTEAFAAGQARIRILQTSEGERLQAAMPGIYHSSLVLAAGTSLEGIRRAAAGQVVRERGLLLVMGVIALFLGVKGARRFLKPLMELERRAGQVMALDFSARMAHTRDDELGRLAQAFNQMAEGVQQGRLLRQFVSDSVQAMAGKDTSGEREMQGESLELVVLFAGVSDFKTVVKELPADQLIRGLNEYLAAMAAIVRSQGGEVDKFIGEKILAVFRPDQTRTLKQAQQCGLTAGRAMKKRFQERAIWKGTSLGIGLAAGSVLSGVLGTADVRLEYTVIGDTVNLASRLCDLALKESCGTAGGTIIMNRTGRDLLVEEDGRTSGPLLRPAGEVALKGKARKVEIFRTD